MCVFPLFIDVALLGVIFVFLVSGFLLSFSTRSSPDLGIRRHEPAIDQI